MTFEQFIEKSYSNINVLGGSDICSAKSFEELWSMRLDVKNKKYAYPAKNFWNKILIVMANTNDIEKYLITSCLKQNSLADRTNFIENVKCTLDEIKQDEIKQNEILLKKITRDKITLTVDDVKFIQYQLFKTSFEAINDEKKLIQTVGVDKWFEFKSDEYKYKLMIIEEIPHIMAKVCKDMGISY
jgi:hypothetical protein